MKLKMKRIVSAVLTLVMCAGLLCGCGGGSEVADNTLIWYTTGKETTRTADVLAKINEILLEKTGYQVEFRYLSTQAYDLMVSSGEEIDIIQAPDYLNFWSNAAKGAFSEITDEDLKKNAPYIWENGGDAIDVLKVDGMRYSIARFGGNATNRCIAARGDIMEKAGIETIDGLESIEKYLDYVKANYPNMIPFDVEGSVPYQMFSLLASDERWSPVNAVSYASPVYFKLDDPEHKLFIAAEQPETLEFTKTMKRWKDKGFFSKSVLSNKTPSVEAFKAGRTALAFVDNLPACQKIWDEVSKDDRVAWNVKFFPRYQKSQLVGGLAGTMVALGATTNKKEAALKVLNECYSNKDVYRMLITGGIEGIDWIEKEDGTVEYKTGDDLRAYFAPHIKNPEFDFNQIYTFPGHEELEAKLEETIDFSLGVSMPKNEENVREILVALTEVWNQYSAPRCYGMIEKSPEEALKEEVELLKKAGIDEYIKELQSQLDAFYESNNK